MRLLLVIPLLLAGCATAPTIETIGTLTRVEVRTLTGSVVTTTINLDRPGAVAVQSDGSIVVTVAPP